MLDIVSDVNMLGVCVVCECHFLLALVGGFAHGVPVRSALFCVWFVFRGGGWLRTVSVRCFLFFLFFFVFFEWEGRWGQAFIHWIVPRDSLERIRTLGVGIELFFREIFACGKGPNWLPEILAATFRKKNADIHVAIVAIHL